VLRILALFITFAVISCDNNPAQQIVDDAIETHGGKAYETLDVEFDFRNRHYTATRKQGAFVYTREFKDSTGTIKDVLNNDGLKRYRGDSLIDITDERRKAFTNSVNSVVYFALLPFGLNDEPVIKEWVEQTTVKGEPYDVVRVTFKPHGAGKDHEDVFLYWIHQNKKTMDYFAYSYLSDGGGIRFREALNPRKVGGILFQDYINYKPSDESIPVDSLQTLFTNKKLEKLSEINMENVKSR
jgi:hypothetical protein